MWNSDYAVQKVVSVKAKNFLQWLLKYRHKLRIAPNKDQSNLATGGIAMKKWRFQTPKPPFRGGNWGPCLTQCYWGHTNIHAKWHLILCNCSRRVHECDRWHIDGQTIHGNICRNMQNRWCFQRSRLKTACLCTQLKQQTNITNSRNNLTRYYYCCCWYFSFL